MGSSIRGRMNAGGSARQEKRANVKLMMSSTAPPFSPGSDLKAPSRRVIQNAEARDVPRAEKKGDIVESGVQPECEVKG